jgi:hypothetical protein
MNCIRREDRVDPAADIATARAGSRPDVVRKPKPAPVDPKGPATGGREMVAAALEQAAQVARDLTAPVDRAAPVAVDPGRDDAGLADDRADLPQSKA